MIPQDYWSDIDSRLKKLVQNGSVKLPSLSAFDLDSLAVRISSEMKDETFLELSPSHKKFLDSLSVNEILAPKLLDMAQKVFGYKGDLSSQYHIARRVEPGNSKEMYRVHFDSHLFTMVMPIKIPAPPRGGYSGDLIYFPNARSVPTGEMRNAMGKAYYKRFASKEGLEKFSLKQQKKEDSFREFQPLLFLGNTTLHTNYPVSLGCSSYRLTLLAHFFDPSPKYGVGRLLRAFRNR